MDGRVTGAVSKPRNSARVAQACSRCKEKKVRCDGKTPSCSLCAKLHCPCEYAAAPRKRGPGRSKKYIQDLEARLRTMEKTLERAGLSQARASPEGRPSSDIVHSTSSPPAALEGHPVSSNSGNAAALSSAGSRSPAPDRGATTPLWHMPNVNGFGVEFLMPVHCRWNQIRRTARNDKFKQEVFAPFTSMEPNRRFIAPIFDDVMAPIPFLKQSNFEAQLEDRECFDRPAWRASVGAILALTTCFRAANEAFREAHRVAWAYYKTAFAVFPQLITSGGNMEAVEAILLMALFLRRSPDMQTLSMLVPTTSRLLQILTLCGSTATSISDSEANQQRDHVLATIFVFNEDLSLTFGLPSLYDEATVDSKWSISSGTPTTAIYHRRVKLAMIKAEIKKSLYSGREISAEHAVETMFNLNASIVQWKIDSEPTIESTIGLAALEDLDTSLLVHMLDLRLEYYSCLQMIHWPARRYQLDPVGLKTWVPRNPPAACSFNGCAEAAVEVLRLFQSLYSLPYSSLWSFLSHFVSAHIILLTIILDRPTDQEARSHLAAMESFTQSLKAINQDGLDIEQILVASDAMLSMARNALDCVSAAVSSAGSQPITAKAQAALKLINQATHPMHIIQNFMCNLKNHEFDTAVALAHELDIQWTREQRYGPFVPESLMPETYAFGFEVEVLQEDCTHPI